MELFAQAFVIMVVGMALVFCFLAVVILSVNVTSALVRRMDGEIADAEPPPGGDDEQHARRRAAAIAVALRVLPPKQHRTASAP